MNDFCFCFTLFITFRAGKSRKLRNGIFEIPIIPQNSNIDNQRITRAKSPNHYIIRKFIEYPLVNFLVRAISFLTVFDIMMFEGSSII